MTPRSAQIRLDAAAVLVYLALGAMFSATPLYVTGELGGGRAVAGFSVSVFFVAAVITRPLVGRAVDRHGRRLFLVVPPIALVALTLGLHAARWVPVVLVLRFLQGVAGSAFYTAAITASTDLAAPDRAATAVARLSISIYLGFAAGPAIGEVLSEQGAGMTWTVLAGVLSVGAAVAWTLPETRVPAAVEVAPDATGPGRTRLLHPAAVAPGVALLGLGIGYASVTAHSALYARSIGLSSSTLLFITFSAVILLVRLGAGRLADTVGPRRVMAPGAFALTLGAATLAALRVPAGAVAGVALVGLGWALVFPAVTSWLAGRVDDAERGSALGSLVAFMDVGQGGGGYLVGAVADGFGFGWAYAVPALSGALATAVLATLARRTPPRPVASEPIGS